MWTFEWFLLHLSQRESWNAIYFIIFMWWLQWHVSSLCCKIVSQLFNCTATTVHEKQSDRQTYQSWHCYCHSSVIDINEMWLWWISRWTTTSGLLSNVHSLEKLDQLKLDITTFVISNYLGENRQGGFHKANMKTVFLHFHQFATKDENILDLFYSNIKEAFKAAPRPHLGPSDHLSVMLIPAYRPLLIRK